MNEKRNSNLKLSLLDGGERLPWELGEVVGEAVVMVGFDGRAPWLVVLACAALTANLWQCWTLCDNNLTISCCRFNSPNV